MGAGVDLKEEGEEEQGDTMLGSELWPSTSISTSE